LSLITKKGPGVLGQLLRVLLHHHLEVVAKIGLEAQKMVVVEMEEGEKSFPHID
jgi:hypothetical protein